MSGQPITIRNLGPEDAHILDRVADGVFDTSVDPTRTFGFLATRVNDLVVALHSGTVVGFASGTVLLQPDQATAFLIQKVRVAEDFRRMGIATRLLNRLNDLARDRGCEDIWLATTSKNEPARGLFKKLGSRETTDLVIYSFDDA